MISTVWLYLEIESYGNDTIEDRNWGYGQDWCKNLRTKIKFNDTHVIFYFTNCYL